MPASAPDPFFVIRRIGTMPCAYWNQHTGMWTLNVAHATGYRTAKYAEAVCEEFGFVPEIPFAPPLVELVQLIKHPQEPDEPWRDT